MLVGNGFSQTIRQEVSMNLTLPTDSEARKDIPLLGGCLRYFPAALAGVAKHSKAGNDKHNPGEPLHHARGKSMDHEECILRHLTDLQDLQAVEKRENSLTRSDMVLAEVNALCWRALALSQELHEKLAGAPLAPGAKLPKTLSQKMRDEGFDMRKARKGTSELRNDEPSASEALRDAGGEYPTEQPAEIPKNWTYIVELSCLGFLDEWRNVTEDRSKAAVFASANEAHDFADATPYTFAVVPA